MFYWQSIRAAGPSKHRAESTLTQHWALYIRICNNHKITRNEKHLL